MAKISMQDLLPLLEDAFIRGGIPEVHAYLKENMRAKNPSEKVRVLIKHDIRDNEGANTLQLLKYGPDIQENGPHYSMLQMALKCNLNEVASRLIELGADIHYQKSKQNCISMAVMGDNLDGLLLLEKHGLKTSDTEGDMVNVLHDAAYHGAENVMDHLLSLGMDPNAISKYYRTVIGSLSGEDKDKLTRMFDQLVKSGANVQQHGRGWPLRDAVINQNLNLVEKLARAGADLSATDEDGLSLFVIALKMKPAPQFLERLVELGVPPGVPLTGEWSFLNTFISHGMAGLIKSYLSTAPERVDMVCYKGMTMLQFVASYNKYGPYQSHDKHKLSAMARALLEAGADVNNTGETGWSPLMLAAKSGLKELVGILIEAGADPSIQSPRGRTAEAVAATQDIYDMIQSIEKTASPKP